MGKESNVEELEPEFVKALLSASKSGHDEEKVEVLKRATELLKERDVPFSRNVPAVNLCTGFLMFGEKNEMITTERLEIAIVHTKFLNALIKNAPKSGIKQHAVVSGFVSGLFDILYRARNDKTLLNDPVCDEFEHRLKFLCQAVLEDEHLKNDVPFIIASSLKAERRPSISTLVLVSGCSDEQIALLSTNLPTKEKQLFSQLLQRVKQSK